MTLANVETAPGSADTRIRKSRNVNAPAKARPNRRFEKNGSISPESQSRIEPVDAQNNHTAPAMIGRARIPNDRISEIQEPQTAEEMHLVESLAIAKAKLDAAESAWNERLHWQKSHAAELFDRTQLQRFQADLKLLRTDPWGMQTVFGKTWHSATFLCDLWRSVLHALDSKVGLTFDQIKYVIHAIGGDWRVDRLDSLRGHIMCSFLALHPNAESFLDHWVAASRARRPDRGAIDIELDRLRARAFLDAAPSAEKARESLRAIAEKESQIWADHSQRLRKAYVEERSRCAEITPQSPLGDASEVRETRRLRRNLTTAERHFETLERRLRRLLASRTRSKPRQTAASSIENKTVATPHSLSTQSNEIEEDTPRLRNGSAESSEPSSIKDQPNRPAKRPDPKHLAKAWRAKQGRGRNA